MPEKMKTVLVAVIALSLGIGGWIGYSNYKEGQDAIKKLNFIQQQNQMQQRQSRQNINEQMEKQNSDPNVMTGFDSNTSQNMDGQTMGIGNGQQQMMGGINIDSGMSELNSQFAEQAKKMQEEYNKSVEAMNQQSMQEYNKQIQEIQQQAQQQNQGMSQGQGSMGLPEIPSSTQIPSQSQAQMPQTSQPNNMPSMPMQDITNGNMASDITSDASVTVNKMDYNEMNSNNKDAFVNKENQQTTDIMPMGADVEVESILTN